MKTLRKEPYFQFNVQRIVYKCCAKESFKRKEVLKIFRGSIHMTVQ